MGGRENLAIDTHSKTALAFFLSTPHKTEEFCLQKNVGEKF